MNVLNNNKDVKITIFLYVKKSNVLKTQKVYFCMNFINIQVKIFCCRLTLLQQH